MIEHHFTVAYNAETGVWHMVDEEPMFPDGAVYDTSLGKFRPPLGNEIDDDQRAYSALKDALMNLTYEMEEDNQ